MPKQKFGYPKMQSRFICLKCLQENTIGQGIQRIHQREKYHIKDLTCIICNEITKNLEVRHCDYYSVCLEKAKQIQKEYY